MQKKQKIWFGVIALVVLIVVAITVVFYSRYVNEQIFNDSSRHLNEVYWQVTTTVRQKLSDNYSMLRSWENYIAEVTKEEYRDVPCTHTDFINSLPVENREEFQHYGEFRHFIQNQKNGDWGFHSFYFFSGDDINDETKAMEFLERKADCDSRTGLLNHNAAKREITRVLSEAKGRTYALAVFDLDNFKKANDTYGHLFGDEILETVANRIRDNIRSTDIGARMGGDEFIIFMEYKGNAEPQVKRIFKGICGNHEGFDIKISMGVACAEGLLDYNELFLRADSALYAVKSASKNSYKFYDNSLKIVEREENAPKDAD